MGRDVASVDWSLLQSFLAVAEHGSLSAGARVLGISQPTLGRQVLALEAKLGAELFRRHDKGLTPTALGASLVDAARAMREAAHGIALRAAGEGEASLSGSVRITPVWRWPCTIYDDVEGLHIGTNLFAHNEIRGAAVAISLAD
jgi:molybdenum-dependent DNA-binding transcriptional regulator ModE